ncbi:hypothetical protein HDF09_003075 [Edaphobacter lichenicola]|uniref:Uncharacterized protein n=1 Tax=Tunturiibacter empetritectus TaxID=3069691 RepID=A0A7W8IJS5_9BACT|nr:hypothetical protein [Edaphobacter lichenicola]
MLLSFCLLCGGAGEFVFLQILHGEEQSQVAKRILGQQINQHRGIAPIGVAAIV